jgi:hypothetical protein
LLAEVSVDAERKEREGGVVTLLSVRGKPKEKEDMHTRAAVAWVNRDAAALELFLNVLAEHVPSDLPRHKNTEAWLRHCAVVAGESTTVSQMFQKIRDER